MTRNTAIGAVALLTLALLPNLASPAWAGDSFFLQTVGSNFFSASPPCPVKKFPSFENLVPIPSLFDPDIEDSAFLFCQVDLHNGEDGVKKAKGKWQSEIIMRDNLSGDVETFPIDSGRFKTNSDGFADFDFEIPSELFADGFESGDVSAWSYTRSDFTNRKKASSGSVRCGKNVSK